MSYPHFQQNFRVIHKIKEVFWGVLCYPVSTPIKTFISIRMFQDVNLRHIQ